MKSIRYTLVALFGLAVGLYAANLPKTGVAGSSHDISGSGCKSCHAPHNGSLANGGTQGTGAILLWARSFPAAANTFGVYDSATMNNKSTELGGSALTTSTDVRMYSLLCLSCHDGVTSTFSSINNGSGMTNANKVGSKTPAYDSAGLTNDHPVNMSHAPANDAGLQAVATVVASLPLYGASNTVQCSSCHDSHNNTNTNYLRMPNNTTLCTTCHL
ncbi:MAG: cytochrome c3 family protein [Bryobacteraceae bacterium]